MISNCKTVTIPKNDDTTNNDGDSGEDKNGNKETENSDGANKALIGGAALGLIMVARRMRGDN